MTDIPSGSTKLRNALKRINKHASNFANLLAQPFRRSMAWMRSLLASNLLLEPLILEDIFIVALSFSHAGELSVIKELCLLKSSARCLITLIEIRFCQIMSLIFALVHLYFVLDIKYECALAALYGIFYRGSFRELKVNFVNKWRWIFLKTCSRSERAKGLMKSQSDLLSLLKIHEFFVGIWWVCKITSLFGIESSPVAFWNSLRVYRVVATFAIYAATCAICLRALNFKCHCRK